MVCMKGRNVKYFLILNSFSEINSKEEYSILADLEHKSIIDSAFLGFERCGILFLNGSKGATSRISFLYWIHRYLYKFLGGLMYLTKTKSDNWKIYYANHEGKKAKEPARTKSKCDALDFFWFSTVNVPLAR